MKFLLIQRSKLFSIVKRRTVPVLMKSFICVFPILKNEAEVSLFVDVIDSDTLATRLENLKLIHLATPDVSQLHR